MSRPDSYLIEMQSDSARALKFCSANILETPDEYVERSLTLGLHLAHVALEYPETQPLLICAMDMTGVIGQMPLSFSDNVAGPPSPCEPLDDSLLLMEAEFSDLEVLLPRRITVPGKIMRDVKAFAYQLDSDSVRFLMNSVELRNFWVRARSQDADLLLADGRPDLRPLFLEGETAAFD